MRTPNAAIRRASEPDYAAIRRVVSEAQAKYPHANVIGRWYAGEPYAEVWTNQAAATYGLR